jgi:hypothetical protein
MPQKFYLKKKMRELIEKKIFQLLTLTSFSITIYNLKNSSRVREIQSKVEKLQGKNDELRDKTIEVLNKNEKLIESQQELVEESKSLSSCYKKVAEEWKKITDSINKNVADNSINDDELSDQLNKLDNTINEIEECTHRYENIVETARKLVEDGNFRKFIDSDKIIDFFNNINNLSFEDTIYVCHLSGSIAILISIISIITIFYSNQIIEYFKLETKYPRIAKFIQLRRKFQNFYIVIDFIIILFVCVAMIYINLLLLKMI